MLWMCPTLMSIFEFFIVYCSEMIFTIGRFWVYRKTLVKSNEYENGLFLTFEQTTVRIVALK